MGDTAKLCGISMEKIEYRSKEYPIAPMGPEIRAFFEVWLERRASESLRRIRPTLSEEEYREERRALRGDCAAGLYNWDSENGMLAAGSPLGFCYLMYLRLKKASPEQAELTEEFVWQMFEQKGQEMQEAMKAQDQDPNPKAPDQPASI